MTTDQILAEMETIRAMVERWEEARAALDAKIVPARKELDFWNGILRLRQGEAPLEQLSETVGAAIDRGVNDGVAAYGAKARGLRAFIRARADDGVTMRELTAEAARLGSHPNMAYRLVARLTAETDPPELERRGGRIYPTANLKTE